MSNIFKPRLQYKPFHYPEAFTFYQKMQSMHWLTSEIPMSGDVIDWNTKITPEEKNVIASILKGFTQTEVIVADYWSNKVSKWFKVPELQMVARVMAASEVEHQVAYDSLNTSLGIEDYEAFLYDPATKARLDRIMFTKEKTQEEIALSLALFSAFSEGVSLFSSFAILMSFSRRNLLKGVGQITAYSSSDEIEHSRFGCWLFNKVIEENPNLLTQEFKKRVYEAARLTVELEDKFIDMVFSKGEIEGINSGELKQYIRHRCNVKLIELGLKSNWKNLDKAKVENVSVPFEMMLAGISSQDFFAQKEVSYVKGKNFDTMWEV